ncbi:MAG TPA: CheR family methyltransferase, partial [Thermomicrobiales bacterium]|nr:CheR family methyltransferase [Thermomicrobiales bacterium]
MSEAAPETAATQLIVVGASAGGIEALSTLVANLPAQFPAPLVIAQHLDPSRPSHLQEILARRSVLPVRTVTDHAPLEPGIVYVVPANRHVSVSDHAIELRDGDATRPKPSVDLLLSSAAVVFGERLIAVILTGSGSDGAAGAYNVKKAGGTVVIQNPSTASYPGMPQSLAPNTVDIVADLERIGGILIELLAGGEVPARSDGERELDQFLAELRERNGVDFSSYKLPTIRRRLQRRIVATDAGDLAGYHRYLDAHPEEYQQLISAFLIKVTEFFRDPELFAALRAEILPDLIAHARQRGRELRLWSAGCATGEEPYSLAVLVAEALGDELDDFTVRIFATDLDEEAIAFARRGVYAAAALAELPDDVVARYFSAEDGGYQVKKRVRSLVVFGQHDLGQRAPFPRIDLILCRNVLIYFTAELQKRTLQLFAYALRDGGVLALGKAESTNPAGDYFDLRNSQYRIYRRQGDRVLMPPARLAAPTPLPPRRFGRPERADGAPTPPRTGRGPEREGGLTEGTLLRLPIGAIVIDRRYDIQAINSAARRFLAIHHPAIGEDLIHVAQGIPHQRLRQAIDRAFREGIAVTLDEFPVEDLAVNGPGYRQVICYPQRAEGERGRIDTVLVTVADITDTVQARRRLEGELAAAREEQAGAREAAAAEVARHAEQVGRLVETNRQLVEANQELIGANEELRTTNEEFLLSTEEAQATTEEVETLNEEMQATNEELETLNEELQATVEELNTTNDDLSARSVELQGMARASEEERARLQAILAGMGDALLVVDANGAPLLTNAAYDEFFGARGERLVPRDERGRPLPPALLPQHRAASGESFRVEFTTNDDHGGGGQRWFEANGRPVRDSAGDRVRDSVGRQRWGVVVIRDISERSLRRQQEEFIANVSHDLRTPLTAAYAGLDMLSRRLTDRL